MISKPIYLKVETADKRYDVRVTQADAGVFATTDKLDIYLRPEPAFMPTTYEFLAQCNDVNEIGATLRMNLNGIIRIESR